MPIIRCVKGRPMLVAPALLLIAAVLTAALSLHAGDWQPAALVTLLLVLAVGSDFLDVEVRTIRISGSFLALVLAMPLLGPAPAVMIGVVSAGIDAIHSRRTWQRAIPNLAIF